MGLLEFKLKRSSMKKTILIDIKITVIYFIIGNTNYGYFSYIQKNNKLMFFIRIAKRNPSRRSNDLK